MKYSALRQALRIQWQNGATPRFRRTYVAPLKSVVRLAIIFRPSTFPEQVAARIGHFKRRLSLLTGAAVYVKSINRIRIKTETMVAKKVAKQNLKVVLQSSFATTSRGFSIFDFLHLYRIISSRLRDYRLEVGFLQGVVRARSVIELRLVNPDLCWEFVANQPIKKHRTNYVVLLQLAHPNRELLGAIKYAMKDFI